MNFCECTMDGHCNRYNREMRGRMREICAGINCDLGTSAAFRDQWKREAAPLVETSRPVAKPLILKSHQAPGDALVMTAAIYSLHRAHPGKYLTSVDSPYPEIFCNNPDVTQRPLQGIVSELQMHYPAIHDCNNRGIHFMQGYCEFLGAALGIQVPLMTNRPRLYFEQPLRQTQNWRLPFWLICSSTKDDFTTKQWGHRRFQEVVDRLKDQVNFIQVGLDGAPLQGVRNWIGKTSLKQLFHIARLCQGVLCGVSLLMHVAAALEKPAVVIAGGREPPQWNAYPKQHYMHTLGMLPCCHEPCWKSQVEGGCEQPIHRLGDATVGRCMTLVSPEEVAKKIQQIAYHT